MCIRDSHNVSPLLLFALAGFAFLTDDKLADIADALAFVDVYKRQAFFTVRERLLP